MNTQIINHNPRQRRDEVPDYHVFMVRYWFEPTKTLNAIRVTAEDIRTGQRFGFTSWDEFVQHLKQQTVDSPAAIQ